MTKRQAATTLQYVAADLGLDVHKRLFGPPTADGRHSGVRLTVELTEDAGWMTPAPAEPDESAGRAGASQSDDGDRLEDVEQPHEVLPSANGSWRVAASSHHDHLGCGFKMMRPVDGGDARGVEARVETGDDVFDRVVHVVAVAPERARVVLDKPTRQLILAFFESGVEACITDTEIQIMPQVTARALSSRLRNAAQMSRLLKQRLAQITEAESAAQPEPEHEPQAEPPAESVPDES